MYQTTEFHLGTNKELNVELLLTPNDHIIIWENKINVQRYGNNNAMWL